MAGKASALPFYIFVSGASDPAYGPRSWTDTKRMEIRA